MGGSNHSTNAGNGSINIAATNDNNNNNGSNTNGNRESGGGSARSIFGRADSSGHLDPKSLAPPKKEMLVAVTSCKSDGYYNEKAPGSSFKIPRKAPANLKLFHELAVGVKDAYVAVGATPKKPTDSDQAKLSSDEFEARMTLWTFVGNLDFVSFDNT
jgi:hypothetical protein